ncbi:MAG: type II secretion system GspH family protein [bacterium]|nr:type II secretion system GspH family protein [bacterium]
MIAARFANLVRAALRSQRGFTMLEMITVLTMTSVLSALVIVNTGVGDRRQVLRDEASGLVSMIRNIEARAAASEAVPDDAGNPVSRKAYGACATTTANEDPCAAPAAGQPADEYQLYARRLSDTDYTSPPTDPHILETVELAEDVVFSWAGGGYLDFFPPQPTMLIGGSDADRSTRLQYRDITDCTGSADCVTINFRPRAGVVYVE